MLRRTLAVLSFVAALAAAAAPAAAAPPVPSMDPRPAPSLETRSAPAPLRLAESVGLEPLAVLSEASVGARDELDALHAWNAAGRRPMRAGFVRPLPLPHTVTFSPRTLPEAAGAHDGGALVRLGGDRLVWGTQVEVTGAHRLKLHLSGADTLPEGARLWVYGETGAAKGPFGSDLAVEGSLWTPVVRGPSIRLEVELTDRLEAGRPVVLTLDSVAELLALAPDGAPVTGGVAPKVDTSCLQNAECVSDLDVPLIEVMQRATGLVFFLRGDFVGLCSGGLLNSASQSPFFLTAGHCIDTRASAATVDVFWDATQECGGSGFNEDLWETFGGDLLATDPSSDFSLLLLDAIPPGRALLGWDGDLATFAPGSELHRVSHPVGDAGIFPQSYSRHRVLASPQVCTASGFDAPPLHDLTRFGYSRSVAGGTISGSSGAPLVTDGGRVVGQLFGTCGPDPTEGCDPRNQKVDGLFANTLQFISSYLLDPEGDGHVPPPAGPWLRSGSFPGFDVKVEITGGAPIRGRLEGDCIPQTLCVSGALAGRPEVFIKVIGPRPNGFLWTQISRFTPSKVEVWLRQEGTEEINYYLLDAIPSSELNVSGLQDRSAFRP